LRSSSTLRGPVPDQHPKVRITKIREEFRPKVREAGSKLLATIREEVEAVVAVIEGCEESPPVKGDTYRVAARSVVMLLWMFDGRG
jgi:hypothetical protein